MPHPYISGANNLAYMVNQLRKNFPVTVTSETVKKFAIAPNNESSIINALQFIGAIDADGKRFDHAHDVFIKPDPDFQTAFSEMVEKAYSDLLNNTVSKLGL